MSKIAISGAATGTATFTIESPATNTNRTITLPDATGTLALTGAASNKIEEGDSKVEVTDTGSNGTIVFNTDGTEAMRVLSTQDVAIGETSRLYTSRFTVAMPLNTRNGPFFADTRAQGTGTGGFLALGGKFNTAGDYRPFALIRGAKSNGTDGNSEGFLTFETNNNGADPTERARITSGGNLLVGTTTEPFTVKLNVTQTADLKAGLFFSTNASYAESVLNLRASRNTTNSSYVFLQCSRDGVIDCLFIFDSGNVTNTNNSYGANSDIKLKQDIVDAASQWDDIKNLRVRKFRYKSDPDGFMQLGLVAQEAELVSPGLIDEHPDYEEVEVPVLDDEGNSVLDEDGNPQVTKERNALGTTTKAIKYSVLYMKAVKALQEAIERIETLEAKVAALENNNA